MKRSTLWRQSRHIGTVNQRAQVDGSYSYPDVRVPTDSYTILPFGGDCRSIKSRKLRLRILSTACRNQRVRTVQSYPIKKKHAY